MFSFSCDCFLSWREDGLQKILHVFTFVFWHIFYWNHAPQELHVWNRRTFAGVDRGLQLVYSLLIGYFDKFTFVA